MSDKPFIKASKFSGLGNEILLIDLIRQSGNLNSTSIKKIVKDSLEQPKRLFLNL